MTPESGLEAFPYSFRGMRPALKASRPASVASFIAVAIKTGACAPLMAVLTSSPETPNSMHCAQSLAVHGVGCLGTARQHRHQRRAGPGLDGDRDEARHRGGTACLQGRAHTAKAVRKRLQPALGSHRGALTRFPLGRIVVRRVGGTC